MTEEKELSLYNQQKLTKPKIEEVINENLDSDMQKDALNFVKWLRERGMSPGWYGQNRWKASNRGAGICFLFLESGYLIYKPPLNLRIRLDLTYIKEYEESIMNEGLQNIIWDHISYCHNCSVCAPGKDITFLDKELKGICKTMILYFIDPDKATLNSIKKLLEFEKKTRKEKAEKCKYT